MDVEVNNFQMRYRIVNISSQDVIVKVKGGLTYIVRRNKQPTFRKTHQIIVDMEHVNLEDLKIEADKALTKLDYEILTKFQAEKERLMNGTGFFYKGLTNSMSVIIELGANFVEKNDAIASELLGLSLYCGVDKLDMPAVNTPSYSLQELLDKAKEKEELQGTLHYAAYVNDPHNVTNPFYTNIMGRSVQIPVLKNKDINSGLYIAFNNGIQPQETLYYTFEHLTPQVLEKVGVFKTKADCENGGNTERYVTAENRSKELSKSNEKLKETVMGLSETVERLEGQNAKLVNELAIVRHDHKEEITRIKHEHWLEVSHLKHQTKMSTDLHKYESRVKDTVTKANIEFVKQKAGHNYWGDFAKAVGTLAGVAFTGYKLLST